MPPTTEKTIINQESKDYMLILEQEKFNLQVSFEKLKEESLEHQTRIRRQTVQVITLQDALKTQKKQIDDLARDSKETQALWFKYLRFQVRQMHQLKQKNNKYLQAISKCFQSLLLDRQFKFDDEIQLYNFESEVCQMFGQIKSLGFLKLDKLSKLQNEIQKTYNTTLNSNQSEFQIDDSCTEWFNNLNQVYEGLRNTINGRNKSHIEVLNTMLEQQNFANSHIQKLIVSQTNLQEEHRELQDLKNDSEVSIQLLLTQIMDQKNLICKNQNLVIENSKQQVKILENVQGLGRKLDEIDYSNSILVQTRADSPEPKNSLKNNLEISTDIESSNSQMQYLNVPNANNSITSKQGGLLSSGQSCKFFDSQEKTEGSFKNNSCCPTVDYAVVESFKIPSPSYSPYRSTRRSSNCEVNVTQKQEMKEIDQKLKELKDSNQDKDGQIEELILNKSDMEFKIRVVERQLKQQNHQIASLKQELDRVKSIYEKDVNKLKNCEQEFVDTMNRIECYEVTNTNNDYYLKLLVQKQIEAQTRAELLQDMEDMSDSDLSGSLYVD